MKEYVITDEMLKQWRGNCINLQNPHTNDDFCKKCQYRGKGSRKGCCDFDGNHMEDIFRSRPLSAELEAERERVLDEVMGTISDLNLPCNMNPYDTVACIRGEIETLRGEP